jgi:L-lactate dehydrogenase complex protein LldF
VYPGPIGAILTPQLRDDESASSLPFASSLCGACYEVCPVKIDIPRVLLHLRAKTAKPAAERTLMRGAGWIFGSPRRFDLAQRLARTVVRRDTVHRLPPPLSAWTRTRDLKGPPAGGFRSWWRSRA